MLAIVLLVAGSVALVAAAKRSALRETPDAAGWPAGETASGSLPGLLLSDVSRLAGPEVAGAETISLTGPQVPRITITVDTNGAVTVGKVAKVSPWRGVDLPRDICPPLGPSSKLRHLVELVVHLQSSEGRVRIKVLDWEAPDLATFKSKMAEAWKVGGSAMAPPIIAAGPDVPFGHVAGVTAVLLDIGCEPEFRPVPMDGGAPPLAATVRAQIGALAAKFAGPDELSALGVRIRADSRAPWGVVQRVMEACAQAKVWRISFGCFASGREVVLGRVRIEASARSRPALIKPDRFYEENRRDIFRETPPIDPPEEVPSDSEPKQLSPEEGEGIGDIPLGP